MVTAKIDDDLILSYDVHPSASCVEFLQMILHQYDGRNHPKSTSIIAPLATHIWISAGIKTFSDLINIGKNLDPLTGEPYTVSRMRSDLTKATMTELIGRVRERNLTVEDHLNDNDKPKGDIDPISERVLREAWIVGLIVWLPAELGRRCAELQSAMKTSKRDIGYHENERNLIGSLLIRNAPLVDSRAQIYRGSILNRPCVMDYATKLDGKDNLTDAEAELLSWYFMMRKVEGAVDSRDKVWYYDYIDGELQVRNPKPKKPPASDTPPKKVQTETPPTPTTSRSMPPPTSPPPPPMAKEEEQGTPTSANKSKEKSDIENQDKKSNRGSTREDLKILAENQFLTQPVPPGQMAPELRFPSLAPPDYATHFTGKYKAIPIYDEGRYTGYCNKKWVNYPQVLTWDQLPENAKATFMTIGEHWADRVFFSEGIKYQFSDDGLQYWKVEDPITPKKDTGPGSQPTRTPWSNKNEKESARVPLQYEAVQPPTPTPTATSR